MDYENSNGNWSSYANNSGNSYTYTYTNITNNFDHSFNHTNSHNGHGRTQRVPGCGVIGALLLAAIPIIVAIVFCNVLAGWLT